jgi:hypothetical protein
VQSPRGWRPRQETTRPGAPSFFVVDRCAADRLVVTAQFASAKSLNWLFSVRPIPILSDPKEAVFYAPFSM